MSRKTALRASLFALLFAIAILAVGCDNEAEFKAQIKAQLPAPQADGLEVSKVRTANAHVKGVTTEEGQSISIDCTVSIKGTLDGKPFERTFKVGLHSEKLPKGTEFEIKCDDPLIMELPSDASAVRATATHGRAVTAMTVLAGQSKLALGRGKTLNAEPGTQLVVIGFPPTVAGGTYDIRIAFHLARARPIKQKMLIAAEGFCNSGTFYTPILPTVTSMGAVPAVTIPLSTTLVNVGLPRVKQSTNINVSLPCGS